MDSRHLGILWTSQDKDVALKMVFMYARASMKNQWWDAVKLIIWGPSAKLLAQDDELAEQLGVLQGLGVSAIACKSCADMYGVSDKLEALGVDVFYVGQAFTEMLRSNLTMITV